MDEFVWGEGGTVIPRSFWVPKDDVERYNLRGLQVPRKKGGVRKEKYLQGWKPPKKHVKREGDKKAERPNTREIRGWCAREHVL